jgi:hypothetical protein
MTHFKEKKAILMCPWCYQAVNGIEKIEIDGEREIGSSGIIDTTDHCCPKLKEYLAIQNLNSNGERLDKSIN